MIVKMENMILHLDNERRATVAHTMPLRKRLQNRDGNYDLTMLDLRL